MSQRKCNIIRNIRNSWIFLAVGAGSHKSHTMHVHEYTTIHSHTRFVINDDAERDNASHLTFIEYYKKLILYYCIIYTKCTCKEVCAFGHAVKTGKRKREKNTLVVCLSKINH